MSDMPGPSQFIDKVVHFKTIFVNWFFPHITTVTPGWLVISYPIFSQWLLDSFFLMATFSRLFKAVWLAPLLPPMFIFLYFSFYVWCYLALLYFLHYFWSSENYALTNCVKTKIAPKLNSEGRLYLGCCKRGGRWNSYPLKQKVGGIFEHWRS